MAQWLNFGVSIPGANKKYVWILWNIVQLRTYKVITHYASEENKFIFLLEITMLSTENCGVMNYCSRANVLFQRIFFRCYLTSTIYYINIDQGSERNLIYYRGNNYSSKHSPSKNMKVRKIIRTMNCSFSTYVFEQARISQLGLRLDI